MLERFHRNQVVSDRRKLPWRRMRRGDWMVSFCQKNRYIERCKLYIILCNFPPIILLRSIPTGNLLHHSTLKISNVASKVMLVYERLTCAHKRLIENALISHSQPNISHSRFSCHMSHMLIEFLRRRQRRKTMYD